MTQGSSACTDQSTGDTKAAGNKWQEGSGFSGEIDIKVNALYPVDGFLYYAHRHTYSSINPTTMPSPNSTSTWITNNLNPNNINCRDELASSCSSASGFTLTLAKCNNTEDKIEHWLDSLNNLKNSLFQKLRKGDKQQLINHIHSNLPPGNILNELMDASPYLSDRVLIAALNEKPTPLPTGNIKQIIIANSPVTIAVKSVLDNCSLPNGIRQQINSAQIGVSIRFIAESDINRISAEIQELEKMLADYYTSIGDFSHALEVFEESQLPESQILLAEMQMSAGNTSGSRDALVNILQNSTPENQTVLQNYCDLMNVLLDLQDNNLSVYNITTTQEQIIRNVAASNTSVAVQAEVILSQVFNEVFYHPIMQDNANNLKSINPENYSTEILDEANFSDIFAKIYPNPNNGCMTLKYSLAENQNGKLLIYDITGRKLFDYPLSFDKNSMPVSLSNFANGLYFYRVYSGEKLITEEKLVIFK